MFLWSGLGVLTPVFFIVGTGLGALVIGLPIGANVGAAVAAIANFYVAERANRPAAPAPGDDPGSETAVPAQPAAFLWIAMEWWTFILLGFAILGSLPFVLP